MPVLRSQSLVSRVVPESRTIPELVTLSVLFAESFWLRSWTALLKQLEKKSLLTMVAFLRTSRCLCVTSSTVYGVISKICCPRWSAYHERRWRRRSDSCLTSSACCVTSSRASVCLHCKEVDQKCVTIAMFNCLWSRSFTDQSFCDGS